MADPCSWMPNQWQISEFDQNEAANWQRDAAITHWGHTLIDTEEHEIIGAHAVMRSESAQEVN